MAEILPYPLAIYLKCIGNTMDRKQIITPLLAEIKDLENLSGAVTYAPKQLLPLLKTLKSYNFYAMLCINNFNWKAELLRIFIIFTFIP